MANKDDAKNYESKSKKNGKKKQTNNEDEKANPYVTYGILGFAILLIVLLISRDSNGLAPNPKSLVNSKHHKKVHVKHHHVHTTPNAQLDKELIDEAETNGETLANAPSNSAPSASAPSASAPSASAPSKEADVDDDDEVVDVIKIDEVLDALDGKNPYVVKHVSNTLRAFWEDLEKRRKEKSDFITANFGSWCERPICHDCWDHDNTSKTLGKSLKTCEQKGHTYDNASNWDYHWFGLCEYLTVELEQKYPFPETLKPYLELNYKTQEKAGAFLHVGNVETPELVATCNAAKLDSMADPFSSGSPSGELPFDPVIVQDHFRKLSAALTIFNQGEAGMIMAFKPDPEDPEFPTMLSKMADQFASVFVSGGDLNLAVLGDSVTAGADNCYYDSWPEHLRRQLHPLFAAAKVNFQVQNAAHNGGYPMSEMIDCFNGVFTKDKVDFLIQYGPFVRATVKSYELLIQNAIANGVIVNIGGREGDWSEYYKFGFSKGPVQDDYSQLLYQHTWFPTVGKSHWGRIGDGLCHHKFTRGGSRSIHSRNWHPGPARHQMTADRYAFLWSLAAEEALGNIITELKKSGGKVAPLQAKWPRHKPVDVAALPSTHVSCEDEKKRKLGPRKQVEDFFCNPTKFAGLPQCRGIPIYDRYITDEEKKAYSGPVFDDWVVTEDSAAVPKWGGEFVAPSLSSGSKPKSYDRWAFRKLCSGTDDVEMFGGDLTIHRKIHADAKRSEDQCRHKDHFRFLAMNSESWITLKIPANTMVEGYVSLCAWCKGHKEGALVQLQTSSTPKKQIQVDWSGDRYGHTHSRDDGACGTVASNLNEQQRHSDVYIGVTCPAGGVGGITYVFAH